jgi:hypothetical protein
MYYQPGFLHTAWQEYRSSHSVSEENCDPDHFVRWTYARALAHRQPRYDAMADWGVTITAEDVLAVTSPADFDALIARVIDTRHVKT